jgi:hypothetical protein
MSAPVPEIMDTPSYYVIIGFVKIKDAGDEAAATFLKGPCQRLGG